MTGDTDGMLLLAERIIHAAPNLREIEFSYDGIYEEGLVQAIMGLKNLESLFIDVNALSTKWFYDVVMHHAARLTDIGFTLYYGNGGDQMPSFGFLKHVPRLRRLNVTLAPLGIPRDITKITEAIASSCLGLETLTLNYTVSSIPFGSITAFKRHPRLTKMEITAESMDDSDLVSVLSIPNLNHLILHVPLKDPTIELLRSKIARVEYKPRTDVIDMYHVWFKHSNE
ncbi:hypothetical protein O0I10_006672 [Lichtheimia ornata]|uniref:RNI-like protein n=1 Tax=Lichtheimia ornata TaxID=688661 RepID=A0AAD7XYG0_9FUNG|nr:uncharacterized protein O0I10_006672 [Lichtheimia ornata]KAJ8657608.1 hypothetical protein O0I10_006672 [Lichtheimia ornata]